MKAKKFKQGEEQALTNLMNKHTFTKEEIAEYPYHLRHTFVCVWDNRTEPNDYCEVTLYATSDKALKEYISANYTCLPDVVVEIITKTRTVDFRYA